MAELFNDPVLLFPDPAVLFEAPSCLICTRCKIDSSILRADEVPKLERPNHISLGVIRIGYPRRYRKSRVRNPITAGD